MRGGAGGIRRNMKPKQLKTKINQRSNGLFCCEGGAKTSDWRDDVEEERLGEKEKVAR